MIRPLEIMVAAAIATSAISVSSCTIANKVLDGVREIGGEVRTGMKGWGKKEKIHKRNKELITKILGSDTKLEEIEGMLESSEFVDGLVKWINQCKSGETKIEQLPYYLQQLISDGVLDIAILVGAEYEDEIPIKGSDVRFMELGGRSIVLRIRYIDNIQDAKKAFEKCDVIYVDSHSRYGLGWALTREGMDKPLRMQPQPVKIPKDELHGYKGKVLKNLGNGEVIVQASDEDIKQIKPRRDYQLISMGSCSSGEHFLEIIKRLRNGLPTTIIYSTIVDIYGENINCFLKGLLEGKTIEGTVEKMNVVEREEYISRGKAAPDMPYRAIILNVDQNSPQSTKYDNIKNQYRLNLSSGEIPNMLNQLAREFGPYY